MNYVVKLPCSKPLMTGSTTNANISLGSSLQLQPQTQREVLAPLPSSVRFSHRWKYFVLIPIAIALVYLFTMQSVLTNRQNLAIRVEKAEIEAEGGSVSNVNSTGGMLLRPSAHLVANTTKCAFCEGERGIPHLDLVVPRTGGNTCGSIKSMAAGEINGSIMCATLQKEENVCCPRSYSPTKTIFVISLQGTPGAHESNDLPLPQTLNTVLLFSTNAEDMV